MMLVVWVLLPGLPSGSSELPFAPHRFRRSCQKCDTAVAVLAGFVAWVTGSGARASAGSARQAAKSAAGTHRCMRRDIEPPFGGGLTLDRIGRGFSPRSGVSRGTDLRSIPGDARSLCPLTFVGVRPSRPTSSNAWHSSLLGHAEPLWPERYGRNRRYGGISPDRRGAPPVS